MDDGKKVYPKEMFGTCDDIVQTVKKQRAFSEQAFSYVLMRMNLIEQADSVRQALKKAFGIEIVPKVHLCSRIRQEELEKNYWDAYSKHMYQTMPTQFRIQFSI